MICGYGFRMRPARSRTRFEGVVTENASSKDATVNSARLAIAELTVASLDDAFSVTTPSKRVLDRAGRILKPYPHIIEYWSCPDAHTEDEMFHITPWIRSL